MHDLNPFGRHHRILAWVARDVDRWRQQEHAAGVQVCRRFCGDPASHARAH
jgi:hypothetical protein